MRLLKILFFYTVMMAGLLTGCKSRNVLFHPGSRIFYQHAPNVFKVRLETTKGNIIMEVRREWAPNGVDRFYNLVQYGYYNNTAFFRVRDKTWAQFGIAGVPEIAQLWRTNTIPDDLRKVSNERGMVAFAFKDPNGRTTQVFINLRNNSSTLDAQQFAPFAKVIQGMDVADTLYAGYGENSGGGIRAGHQDSLFIGGNTYLKQHFPKLDYIKRAIISKN
ncbi:MAG: peptidylprolyl isomerase [Bacteroidota bacterium]|nr:peptidylprolyl isomerase [Bacteroidota bacterium]